MRHLAKVLLLLAPLAVLAAAADPAAAAEKPARGTVKSVAADLRQISVTDANGKLWTYQVLEPAAFFNTRAVTPRLADFRAGDDVTVLWEKRGDKLVASAVLLHEGDFKNSDLAEGTVTSVAPDSNQLTVTDSAGKAWTYHLTDSSKLALNNRGAKLGDFKAGEHVTIAWDKTSGRYTIMAMCNCPGTAR
jgi:hypothetical protein